MTARDKHVEQREEQATVLSFPRTAPTSNNLVLVAQHYVPQVGHFSRTVSVHEEMSVAEFKETVLTCYSWEGNPLQWSLRAKKDGLLSVYGYSEDSIALSTPLKDAIGTHGVGSLVVDDFQFYLTVVDTRPRELGDPDAECLSGDFVPDLEQACPTEASHLIMMDNVMGQLHPHAVPKVPDVDAVNKILSGDACTCAVLEYADPEVAFLLSNPQLKPFLPLILALDLERPVEAPEYIQNALGKFPAETSPQGRAAAWAYIITGAALGDADMVQSLSDKFLNALGLVPEDIHELCPETIARLHALGLSIPGTYTNTHILFMVPPSSIVERLEAYRFLLQKPLH